MHRATYITSCIGIPLFLGIPLFSGFLAWLLGEEMEESIKLAASNARVREAEENRALHEQLQAHRAMREAERREREEAAMRWQYGVE